jgi:hypothetical protein
MTTKKLRLRIAAMHLSMPDIGDVIALTKMRKTTPAARRLSWLTGMALRASKFTE